MKAQKEQEDRMPGLTVYEFEAAERRALREMELLKAELLATVSHELRSPLASIKGYAGTLLRHERRISREERHDFLVAIVQASDRLEALIDRLLEMSQLETGSITLERSSVHCASFVREAITAIEQRLAASGREASAHGSPFIFRLEDRFGMPTRDEPVIQADRSRLREVLDNLLENAINYSPAGGTIEVLVHPVVSAIGAHTVSGDGRHKTTVAPVVVSGDQELVEMCVRDHGIGIPPAHLERIFESFHRVDTRLTREVNGIGLGLAMCKRIVQLHGGTIWAESESGKGSTFHVWLPVDGHT